MANIKIVNDTNVHTFPGATEVTNISGGACTVTFTHHTDSQIMRSLAASADMSGALMDTPTGFTEAKAATEYDFAIERGNGTVGKLTATVTGDGGDPEVFSLSALVTDTADLGTMLVKNDIITATLVDAYVDEENPGTNILIRLQLTDDELETNDVSVSLASYATYPHPIVKLDQTSTVRKLSCKLL